MKKTVLIVEHDAQIVREISEAMSDGQYSLIKASDEQSALRNFQQFQPDIALIDTNSNGMRVMDIYRSFRNQRDIPVIFINGEGTESDELHAFASGVDDYIPQPLSSKVLVARMDAILRRNNGVKSEKTRYIVGPLELDSYQHIFKVHGVEVPLTRTEFEILKELISAPERAVTHDHLIKNVWGEWFSSKHMIESHVSRLRAKVRNAGGPTICEAVRGVGYRLGIKK
jgi:DNA-binding response OmpR family regulator